MSRTYKEKGCGRGRGCGVCGNSAEWKENRDAEQAKYDLQKDDIMSPEERQAWQDLLDCEVEGCDCGGGS